MSKPLHTAMTYGSGTSSISVHDATKATVETFRSKLYAYVFVPEEGSGYCVRVLELPGCISYGDTLEEAYDMILDEMELRLKMESIFQGRRS